ncbi:MAG: phosphoglycerate dehydrogenase [Candidatus Margulisbacteria bacterium]|nr:phosphoglycerate dehydrogenase [Candidatus Margulisiibacteriota bacterium]MBU1022073.1 phosphoglycerate dehydrogenase [Candidatus Margulisiibacteriota bacterium]MBU1729668.1 phosphoglycerate dehydrogenase [Candidatus Margulisiibacteriota bacterium]MBU1954988.1 phosphoglycerate dehydrogenase [Candidatus Margulisiibacteriota bacterium]
MAFKVLAADKIAEDGLKMLKEAGFQADMKTGLPEAELVKIIPEYDAIVVRSATKVTAKIIEAGKKLKIIARAGVGVDNVDIPAATAKGIIVVNSPEGNTIAAAEHSFAMILSVARNIPQAHRSLVAGAWDRKKYMGVELYGKTLGLVGLGKIGSKVASFAQGFEMKVIAYDPFVSEEMAKKIGVELRELDTVLKEADYISLHLPKNKDTLNLINTDKLKLMKKSARLVNCARGGIVNEDDLAQALKDKVIAGAAIDVFAKEPTTESPLFGLDNCITVPHLGASTQEAQVNVAIDVVEQIIDVLNGGEARSAVNIPSMKPEVMARVKPYMGLAEKLGSLASQLSKGALDKVKVSYIGEIADLETGPLTMAVLKGLLSNVLEESVNFVNAGLIAKQRGIKIVEARVAESEDYANLIHIKVEGKDIKREVGGSLFGGRVGAQSEHIVLIDGFNVDAIPEDYLLVIDNIDKPGMIGKVGTLLGKHKINIAAMDVGRQKISERAVMVINIDNEVPDKVLKELTKIDGISNAVVVKL